MQFNNMHIECALCVCLSLSLSQFFLIFATLLRCFGNRFKSVLLLAKMQWIKWIYIYIQHCMVYVRIIIPNYISNYAHVCLRMDFCIWFFTFFGEKILFAQPHITCIHMGTGWHAYTHTTKTKWCFSKRSFLCSERQSNK